jgi:hypothetical protein
MITLVKTDPVPAGEFGNFLACLLTGFATRAFQPRPDRRDLIESSTTRAEFSQLKLATHFSAFRDCAARL